MLPLVSQFFYSQASKSTIIRVDAIMTNLLFQHNLPVATGGLHLSPILRFAFPYSNTILRCNIQVAKVLYKLISLFLGTHHHMVAFKWEIYVEFSVFNTL